MIVCPACQCVVCRQFATREAVDEYGQRLTLCDRCPTPAEIQQRTAEVRASWDELDYWCRRYGLPRDTASDLRALRVEEITVIQHFVPSRHGKPLVPTEM